MVHFATGDFGSGSGSASLDSGSVRWDRRTIAEVSRPQISLARDRDGE